MNGLEEGAPAGTTPPAAESSTAQIEQDAPPVSSTGTGDQAEHTPTAADELAEFKAEVAKATGAEASPESKTETETPDAKPTDEPAEGDGKEKTPEALSQEKQDTKVPEKLTDRPEWKKITAIADKLGQTEGKEARAILRGMFKQQHELATLVEKLKPAETVMQEMLQSVGGSEQGFNNMRHLIRSFEQDPAGAIPMLETLIQDAKQRAGAVVHSPELLTKEQQLQKSFDEGLIDQGEFDTRKAELLELQQARQLKATAEKQRQTEQQRQSAAQQQQAINDLNQTETSWTADKQKNDPDFPALQEMHGIYVQKNVAEFATQQGRWPNAQEATDLLEKSYKQAKTQAMQFRPKPKERQAITGGQGSSGNNRQQPATELDEFKADVERSLKRFGR